MTSSLVLHQCSLDAKAALLSNAYALLKPSGQIFLADYGIQPTLLMQLLFNQVRTLDGYENTKPNKDGQIPGLIAAAGFVKVQERWVMPTPSGAITFWTAAKPE